LLELAWAREQLGQVDEDLVSLIAITRHEFYTQIGGTKLDLGAFRAKTRHAMETGEWI